MRVFTRGEQWLIALQTGEEAEALLAAQASPAGNEAMFSLDPVNTNRVEPARRAVELLRFAQLVLPPDRSGNEEVIFIDKEAQHISALMFGVLRRARELGWPTTAHDELLGNLNAQVDAFFDMDE